MKNRLSFNIIDISVSLFLFISINNNNNNFDYKCYKDNNVIILNKIIINWL